jgi:adenylyl-sulfate kinase
MERFEMTGSRPHVFWLFGRSGAGKSTLADGLARDLRARTIPVLRLDGDGLRAGLCAGLGFSEAGRTENLRRAAEAARLGLKSQLCVVASFITPLASQRRLIERLIGADLISFVYLNASLEVCRARDVKGLYRSALDGERSGITALASGFEPPARPPAELETARQTVAVCAARLLALALQRLDGPVPAPVERNAGPRV